MNNKLVWMIYESNEVLLFDLETEKINSIRFDGFDSVCGQIYRKDNEVYIYDYENNQLIKVDLKKKMIMKNKKVCIDKPKLYFLKEMLLIVSKNGNDYVCYDDNFNEIKHKESFFNKITNCNYGLSNMLYVPSDYGRDYLFSGNQVAIVQNGNISDFKYIDISCEFDDSLRFSLFKRSDICKETYNGLKHFLEYINEST